MDDEESSNGYLKYWIIAGAVVILALAAVPARFVYRHLKERHSAAQARFFFASGDYRNAWLSARQALLVNPNNVDACFIMTEVSDLTQSPATLDYCQRLVKISPAITNKLLLASMGLRYQGAPYPLTSQVLDDVSAAALNLPAFHIVSGELDLSLKRMTEAETHFEAASRLQPTNRLFQLNLAVIRLSSTNAETAEDARTRLQQFSNDTSLCGPALRSLIADRLAHKDGATALNYSKLMLATAQVTFNDRLQNLDILKQLRSPALMTQLNALQLDAATNALMAARTASWMEVNGFPDEAIGWLSTLPPNIQTQSPVRLAFVDGYLNTTNWQTLRKFTSSGDWGEINFLRLAFLSRAWNMLNEPLVADGNWSSALSEAGEKLGALTALLELANRWQLPREKEDLLRRIIQRYPDARWAQLSLERLYFVTGNTAGMYQFYLKQFSRKPENAALKNNLAFTALLLKTNVSQACKWALEAYSEQSNSPPVVATYAYALHLQGRDQEGLSVLQQLKPSQLNDPSVALYYGILLSATGRAGEAAACLQTVQTNGRSLLPEEQQLLAKLPK